MRDGGATENRPQLVVDAGDLPATAEALRDLFAASGRLFDRGLPARLIIPPDGSLPSVAPLTSCSVVMEAHRLCRPVTADGSGRYIAATLPDRVAKMYLSMSGEWHLPPLTGVTTSPLLSGDGSVRVARGYDRDTGLWCRGTPDLRLASCPSRADAEAALRQLRHAFCTFPFADAPRRRDGALGIEIIDTTEPPRRDESAFLVALQTAVCRPSLWLAPGLIVTAPSVSGAGSG
jgi:hypothetical protein